MQKKYVILFGFFLFFWSLYLVLAKVPAVFVLNNLSEEIKGLSVTNVSGTLWQGEASLRLAMVDPPLVIKEAKWELSMFALLSFDAQLWVEAEIPQGQLQGDLDFDFIAQSLKIKALTGKVASSTIQPYLSLPFVADGLIDFDLKQLHFTDNQLMALDGRLILQNINLTAPNNIELGTFAVDLNLMEEKPVVKASLTDVDATINLQGLAWFNLKGDYRLEVTTRPKEEANPLILNTLKQFYPQSSSGEFSIQFGQAVEKL